MPMQYVDPSVFMMTERGVEVYHDYDSGGHSRFYLFQVASYHYDSGYAAFDVRELAAKAGLRHIVGDAKRTINEAEEVFDLCLDTLIDNLGIMVEGEG